MMKCKICGNTATIFDVARVLEKYNISYFRCNTCGFVQTQDPFWLKEAYLETINYSDIGLVSRNLTQVEFTREVISLFFNKRAQYLDYGGGYGLFVRLMRDTGYDFYLYEPNCANLFARTFDIRLPTNSKFHLLTAFEVFEHLVDPLAEIEQMLKISQNIFFSTTLLPNPVPKPSQWWYYGLDHGQHVSFFSKASLSHLASRLGVRFYSSNNNYHLLTPKKISPNIFTLVVRFKIARLINQFTRQPSLLSSDYFKVVGRPLK